MKRFLMRFSVLLMLVAFAAPYQSQAQSDVRFGVRVGPAFTEINGLRLASPRTGYSAGAFVSLNLRNLGVLNVEANYVQKGYKVQFDEFLDLNGEQLLGNVDADFKLNYLELPVLLNLKVPIAPSLSPDLFFGGALSFLLSEEVSFENTEPEDQGNFVTDQPLFDGVDFGLVIGLRLNRPVGSRIVSLEGRYTLGVVNLTDDGLLGETLHNQALVVGFGFTL